MAKAVPTSSMTGPSGPLSGVRVIDITTVFMGPSATQMLGDLGADVVKVESPEGDVVRGIGPQGAQKMGPLFLAMNRNKRSIALDLKSEPEGREALLDLVRTPTCWPTTCAPRRWSAWAWATTRWLPSTRA
jgi:crotonobetainyl-CoA:carnitine CoA-transferase CaiB-like acyl-CoA transferase